MSITYPSAIARPSGIVANLPNALIRPNFEELYGFDNVEEGLATPVLTVQQSGDDALLTVGSVDGATSYTFKRNGVTLATQAGLTYTDTSVSIGVTHSYTVEATDGIETKSSSSVSFIIYADFTNSSLSESLTVQNQVNTFTLTFRPGVSIGAATTITLSGLSGSATATNSSLTIAGAGASLFGSVGNWNNNGTLILTVASGQSVPNNSDTTITFDLTNPAFPNSGVSSVTLASSAFNTSAISGTFFNVIESIFDGTLTFATIDVFDNEADFITATYAPDYTIVHAKDTDKLYVWISSIDGWASYTQN